MKRRTEIILETEETVFYKSRRTLKGFCPHCQTIVEIQPIEEKDILSEAVVKENFGTIENTQDHSIEAERVLICRNPLKNWAGILRKNFSSFGRVVRVVARK